MFSNPAEINSNTDWIKPFMTLSWKYFTFRAAKVIKISWFSLFFFYPALRMT